ncbi:MAG: hypothetical protein HYU41_27345 [Candidatus Rokubacteria bacterium]|nr:hypothetical protein [Candidatus Rokubacteria bacterium]
MADAGAALFGVPLAFGLAYFFTRAQEARRLLAERREIIEELERAKRDYVRGAQKSSTG